MRGKRRASGGALATMLWVGDFMDAERDRAVPPSNVVELQQKAAD
jgi:hypothetical protein